MASFPDDVIGSLLGSDGSNIEPRAHIAENAHHCGIRTIPQLRPQAVHT